jgi:lysophospholipase L1-like esterase
METQPGGAKEIMNKHSFRLAVLLPAAAAAIGLALTPAAAQVAPGVSTAPPASSLATQARPPACIVPPREARFDRPLVRLSHRLAAGKPIKIVALGSSSTAGAGASSPAASYPSRLELELTRHFFWKDVTVLNRGANGEEAPDMLARLDASVIAEDPDLVLWQLGTNWVLRDSPLDPKATALHRGLARLKAIRADIVLIDPQFAPKVIAKSETEAMVAQIAAIAKEQNVDLFRRYVLMRHWHDADKLPFETFVSPDGLHMNDWSYGCLAKWIGTAIEEAATRPITTAIGPRTAR